MSSDIVKSTYDEGSIRNNDYNFYGRPKPDHKAPHYMTSTLSQYAGGMGNKSLNMLVERS